MKTEINDDISYSDKKVKQVENGILNKPAMYAIGAIGGSILLLGIVSAPFLMVPASRKLGSLPWMATPNTAIMRALQQVDKLSKSHHAFRNNNQQTRPKLVDLGAGDGRVCTLAAEHFGYTSLGIELNPVLVGLSWYKAWRAGNIDIASDAGTVVKASPVIRYVSFQMRDFWAVPLSTFSVITVFGVRSIMQRLEEKLTVEAGQNELYVVCYRFPLPSKQPLYAKDELFIYRFPAEKKE